jgi:hypothetical protein
VESAVFPGAKHGFAGTDATAALEKAFAFLGRELR